MNITLNRLNRAYNLEQPIMLDQHEVVELYSHIEDLMYQLESERKKYDDLICDSLQKSRETVGAMLTATLEGRIR